MQSDTQSSSIHALANQVQQNFIAYMRHFAGLPGVTFVEEDTIWITSDGPPGDGCLLLRSQLPEENTDAAIARVLRRIGNVSNTVDWMIFPDCRPSDLGQRLVDWNEAGGPDGNWMLYGNIGGPGGNWMWLDLDHLPESVPVPDGFHVKPVQNLEMLEAWIDVNARGFGLNDYRNFHAAYARHGFGDDAEAIHYIGYMENTPVTSGTLLMAGGSASVYNVSTPEALRRNGFGGAITHAALQEAVRRGYDETWIWASALGKSVYEKLGYIMADFGIREYQWKKRIQGTDL